MLVKYKGIDLNLQNEELQPINNVTNYYWEIINDNLFFKYDNEIIYADWVDAILIFKISDSQYFSDYIDRYSKFNIKIENGIIKNKFISIYVDESSTFFVKKNEIVPSYSIPKLEEIVSFLQNPNLNTEDKWLKKIIKELKEVISSYSSKNGLPSFDFFQNGGSIHEIITNDINFINGSGYIYFNFGDDLYNIISARVFEYYVNYINKSVDRSTNFIFGSNKIKIVKNKIDFEYIKWALRELNWFVLPPSFFHSQYKVFKSIEITNNYRNFLFDYNYLDEKIKISDYLEEEYFNLNLDKINIMYNSEENCFTFKNIVKDSFLNYLLNDEITYEIVFSNKANFKNIYNYIKEYNKPIEEENCFDDNDHYNRNDWLRDVSGTNDFETMNDVFWNLD